MQRPAALQANVDSQCRDLALFQFKTCPFCMKIRQEMHRLSLPIERRDAQHDKANRAALIAGAGSAKVPCLKITDAKGNVKWLTDSKAIISYLRGRFEKA
jgi:glutathione S-transferase